MNINFEFLSRETIEKTWLLSEGVEYKRVVWDDDEPRWFSVSEDGTETRIDLADGLEYAYQNYIL